MKKLLLPLITLTLATSARADLTITQEVEQDGGGQKMTMTMKIKDQQMRMDANPAATTIIDLKTGDTTTFVHEQKMIIKASGAKLKEVQKQALAQNSDTKVDPPKATGRKETINGYACEEYELNANGGKMDLWITKDVPAAEKAMAELATIGGPSDPVQAALKAQGFSGFPMRTVVEMPGMGKTTVTVIGVNEKPISASEFTAPPGYHEVQLPAGMPGGGSGILGQ